MLHRITLPALILRDYEKRGVFPRYHGVFPPHALMDCVSAKVSSEELKALLDDAEFIKALKFTQSPNLTRAYVRLAEKAREVLRHEPAPTEIGRDGKSAAAGDE